MEILGSLLDAFSLIIRLDVLLFVFLGVVMGIALGILPGLGGIAGMSILIVVLSQFQADPLPGIAMAIGMIAVIPTSDTFASVLLGIPGSSSSQATVLDGFPLAKQGKAAQALSSAFTSSLFGGILGVIVLTLLITVAAGIIVYIRTPAQFMLALFGISMVGILSGRSLIKGLLAAGLGLFVGMLGEGSLDGFVRFVGRGSEGLEAVSDWFGQVLPHKFGANAPRGFIEEWQRYLRSGLGVAMIGLSMFAIPEITELLRQNRSIAGDAKLGFGWRQGFLDWWDNKVLSLWNAFIGVIVGIVPGLGGSVVDWIAYGQTKAIVAARGGDTSSFGQGDIRGVIGPESANNAKEGGGLVPTLLLGLPGSGSMAVFLGILGLFSLDAGPAMFDTTTPLNNFSPSGSTIVVTGLVVTFFIAWTLMIANVLGTGLCFGLSAPIARLTKIPFPALAPFLLIVIFLAVYKISRESFYAFFTLLTLGGLGVLLKRFQWSRPAFLIGFVLSGPLETKFNWAAQRIARGNMEQLDWVLVMGIATLTLLVVAAGVVSALRESRQEGQAVETLLWRQKLPPLLFLGLVSVVFGYMVFAPMTWGKQLYFFGSNINDGQMPHFLGLVFFPLSLVACARAFFWRGEVELLFDEERSFLNQGSMQRGLATSFTWIIAYVFLTALFGNLLATVLFAAALLFKLSPLSWTWNAFLLFFSVLLFIALADLTNTRLMLGAARHLFNGDILWFDSGILEALGDYLLKPQLFEPIGSIFNGQSK